MRKGRAIKRLKLHAEQPFHSLTEAEIGYLAGLWDGEGCFYLSDRGRRPTAQCGISDARLFHFIKERGYGGIIYAHRPVGKNVRIQYNWYIDGDLLKDFLQTITSKMFLKQDQALLLLEAFKYKDNRHKLHEIDLKLRQMKLDELPVPQELRIGKIVEYLNPQTWLLYKDYDNNVKPNLKNRLIDAYREKRKHRHDERQ